MQAPIGSPGVDAKNKVSSVVADVLRPITPYGRDPYVSHPVQDDFIMLQQEAERQRDIRAAQVERADIGALGEHIFVGADSLLSDEAFSRTAAHFLSGERKFATLAPHQAVELMTGARYVGNTPDTGAIAFVRDNFLTGADSSILSMFGDMTLGAALMPDEIQRDAKGRILTPTIEEWARSYAPFGVPYSPALSFGEYEYRKGVMHTRQYESWRVEEQGGRDSSLAYDGLGFLANLGGGMLADAPLMALTFGGSATATASMNAGKAAVARSAAVMSRRWFRAAGQHVMHGIGSGIFDAVVQDALLQRQEESLGLEPTTDERLFNAITNIAGGAAFGGGVFTISSSAAALSRSWHGRQFSKSIGDVIRATDIMPARPVRETADHLATVMMRDPKFAATMGDALELSRRLGETERMPYASVEEMNARNTAVHDILVDARKYVETNYRDYMRLHPVTDSVARAMRGGDREFVNGVYEDLYKDLSSVREEWAIGVAEYRGRVDSPSSHESMYGAITSSLGVPDSMSRVMWNLAAHERAVATAVKAAGHAAPFADDPRHLNERRTIISRIFGAERNDGPLTERLEKARTRTSYETMHKGSRAADQAFGDGWLRALGRKFGREVRVITDPDIRKAFHGAVWNDAFNVIFVSGELDNNGRAAVFFHELTHSIRNTDPETYISILDAMSRDRSGMLKAASDAIDRFGADAWNTMGDAARMDEIVAHYVERVSTNTEFRRSFKDRYPVAAAKTELAVLNNRKQAVHSDKAALKRLKQDELAVRNRHAQAERSDLATLSQEDHVAKSLGRLFADSDFHTKVASAQGVSAVVKHLREVFSQLPEGVRNVVARAEQPRRVEFLRSYDTMRSAFIEEASSRERQLFEENGVAVSGDRLDTTPEKTAFLADSPNSALLKRFPVGAVVTKAAAEEGGLLPFTALQRRLFSSDNPAIRARITEILKEFDYHHNGEKVRLHWDDEHRDLAFINKGGEQVKPDGVSVTTRTKMRQIPGINPQTGERYKISSLIRSSVGRLGMNHGFNIRDAALTAWGLDKSKPRPAIPDRHIVSGLIAFDANGRELSVVAKPVWNAGNDSGGAFHVFDFIDADGRKVAENDILWFERRFGDKTTGSSRVREVRGDGEGDADTRTIRGENVYDGTIDEGSAELHAQGLLFSHIVRLIEEEGSDLDTAISRAREEFSALGEDSIELTMLSDMQYALAEYTDAVKEAQRAHDAAGAGGDVAVYSAALRKAQDAYLGVEADMLAAMRESLKGDYQRAPLTDREMRHGIESGYGKDKSVADFEKSVREMSPAIGRILDHSKKPEERASKLASFAVILADAVRHGAMLDSVMKFGPDGSVLGLRNTEYHNRVMASREFLSKGEKSIMRREATRIAVEQARAEKAAFSLPDEVLASDGAGRGRPLVEPSAAEGSEDGGVSVNTVMNDIRRMLGDESPEERFMFDNTRARDALLAAFDTRPEWQHVVDSYIQDTDFGDRARAGDFNGMLDDLVRVYRAVHGEWPNEMTAPEGLKSVIRKAQADGAEKAAREIAGHAFGEMSAALNPNDWLKIKNEGWSKMVNGETGRPAQKFDVDKEFADPVLRFTEETVADRADRSIVGIDIKLILSGDLRPKRPGEAAVFQRIRIGMGQAESINTKVTKAFSLIKDAETYPDVVSKEVSAIFAIRYISGLFRLADDNVSRSEYIQTGFVRWKLENGVPPDLSFDLFVLAFRKDMGSKGRRQQGLEAARGILDAAYAEHAATIIGRERHNLSVQDKEIARVQGFVDAGKAHNVKLTTADAVYASLTGRITKVGNYTDNIQSNIQLDHSNRVAGMLNAFKALGYDWPHLVGDPQLNRDIVAGWLTGDFNGNVVAKNIHRILNTTQLASLDDLAELGMNIRPSDHWFGHSLMHEHLRTVAKVSAGAPAEWIEAAMGAFDWDRIGVTVGRKLKDPVTRAQYLEGVYQELRSAGLDNRFLETGPDTEGLRTRSMHALIRLKPDKAFDYLVAWENRSPLAAMIEGTDRLAQRTAVAKHLGFNPLENYSAVLDTHNVVGTAGFTRSSAINAVKDLSGELHAPVNPTKAKFGKSVRGLIDIALFMPFGARMTLGDIATNASVLNQEGHIKGLFDPKFYNGYKEAWAKRGDPRYRAQLDRYAGVIALSQGLRAATESLAGGFSGKIMAARDAVFNMVGMNAVQRAHTYCFYEGMRREFADAVEQAVAGKPFKPEMQRTLDGIGVSAKDLAAMRPFVRNGAENGTVPLPFLDPLDVTGPSADAARKMALFMVTKGKSAVIEPDAITRGRLTLGLSEGTDGGEVARFATQYLGFLTTVPVRTWNRFLNGYGPEGFFSAVKNGNMGARGHLATFAGASFAFGYAAMALGEALKGEAPTPVWDLDHRDLAIIAAESGTGGIFARFVLGGKNIGSTSQRLGVGRTIGTAVRTVDSVANGKFEEAIDRVGNQFIPFWNAVSAVMIETGDRAPRVSQGR